MLKNTLSDELREQAGSNSYNRFEYQVYWIVYHMIQEFKNGKEFLVLCEFHDDMAQAKSIDCPNSLEFFQIKTCSTRKEWKINHLFNKTKVKSHSFLGFIFYNFLKFGDECEKCHFVSNIGMDNSIRIWQSVIEDNKKLKDTHNDIYVDIQNRIKDEYKNDNILSKLNKKEFEELFEKFIQNTYIYDGELPLKKYEKIVLGEFVEAVSNEKIYISNSKKIIEDIINQVREKSKKQIVMPISLARLKKEKGISSTIFKILEKEIEDIPSQNKILEDIQSLLVNKSYPSLRIKAIIRRLKSHYIQLLDVSQTMYIDSCEVIRKQIDSTINKNIDRIEDFPYLLEQLILEVKTIIDKVNDIDEVLVEGMLYERLISE